MDSQTGQVMTIANSIIGVSILAMPYCFKQCGIVLSILILIVSSIISRLSCHLLLKSAIIARRRTFEFLAFHAFGSLGKFIIEIGLIGFLVGTCIAFFVIMGDLGPAIVAKITGGQATDTMRTTILMALALFCVLPLGLLRNIDSLSSVCAATIGFYFCLVLKIVLESLPHIVSGDWYDNVELWRPSGILQCLPIFSMALFCQTQIFEIYQVIPNASLEKMNDLIRKAVNSCTGGYIFVGTFGYIAFSKQTFTGNILMSFSNSFMSDVMKIGFVLSVAFSFPLVIFPCRASLHSLLYKQTYTHSLHDSTDKYIPEGRFKTLTFLIVFVSLVTGVMIPNIEFVLGLVGSTIGIMICVVFPATCFICISSKNTNERVLAQIMLFVGVIVMVLGTYANLYAMEEMSNVPVTEKVSMPKPDILEMIKEDPALKVIDIPNTTKPAPVKKEELKEIRHEPPQPEEPAEVKNEQSKENKPVESDQSRNINIEAPAVQTEINKIKEKQEEHPDVIKDSTNIPVELPVDAKIAQTALPETKIKPPEAPLLELPSIVDDLKKQIKNDVKTGNRKVEEVDIEAIKKEEKELLEQEKENLKDEDKKKYDLIQDLQRQNEAQKKLVEDSKKILEEIKQVQQQALEQDKQGEIDKVKQEKIKQIGEIAKKAIEKISGDGNGDREIKLNGKETPAFVKEADKVELTNKEPDAKVPNQDNKKSNIQLKKSLDLIPLPIVISNNLSSIFKNVSTLQNNAQKRDSLVGVNREIPKIVQAEEVKSTEKLNLPLEEKSLDVNNVKADKEINILNVLKSSADKARVITEEKQKSYIEHRDIRSVDNKELLAMIESENKDTEVTEKINSKETTIENTELVTSDKVEDDICDKQDKDLKNYNSIDVTESSIIKMITKLSNPEVVSVKLSQLDFINVNNALKPAKRDLKSYEATKKK